MDMIDPGVSQAVWDRVLGEKTPDSNLGETLKSMENSANNAAFYYEKVSKYVDFPLKKQLNFLRNGEKQQARRLAVLYFMETGQELPTFRPKIYDFPCLTIGLQQQYRDSLSRREDYFQGANRYPQIGNFLRQLGAEQSRFQAILVHMVENRL